MWGLGLRDGLKRPCMLAIVVRRNFFFLMRAGLELLLEPDSIHDGLAFQMLEAFLSRWPIRIFIILLLNIIQELNFFNKLNLVDYHFFNAGWP